MTNGQSIFESIGGFKTMDKWIPAFYKRVGEHPLLIPIFPDDLSEVAHKQYLFMTQFLGGQPLYNEERGHPRLRRRHLPFEITPARREAWLECMHEAMIEAEIAEPYFSAIFERLSMTATHMMNTPE